MAFVYPWYHLWFIPSFLGWVALTWLFRKAGMGDKMMLATALAISVAAAIFHQYPGLYSGHGGLSNTIELALHTFRPYFFFFFVLGVGYRAKKAGKIRIAEYLLPLAFFVLVIYLFYVPDRALSLANMFVFNIFLINIALKTASTGLLPNSVVLEWIGRNSLAIYLWHVVPVLLLRHHAGTGDLLFFYTAAVVAEAIFLILYACLLRLGFLKKYIFGMGQ